MQKLDVELKPIGANCVRPHFEEITVKNQKGITLIALIITIIVMLILVGVTINVALNGGLFEKGEKAAFQTEASTVKEQLEMAKALKVIENDGKLLNDYSGITMDLTDLDTKTKNKYANKIVVAKNGDICYNPANVTDQEKIWLEEIGIIEYININGGSAAETFTFKLAYVVPNATFSSGLWTIPAESFWPSSVSDELKNDTDIHPDNPSMKIYKEIICVNNGTQIPNVSSLSSGEISNGFILWNAGEQIMISITINDIVITSSNYTDYDIEFTITNTAS